MTTPEEGIRAQIKNIEANYSKTMAEWEKVVASSGKSKHSEILAMLKKDHGMTHGNANRVALEVRDRMGANPPAADDPVAALYAGKAELRKIHDLLLKKIATFGDFETAPKRAYESLRRRKQFAILQPASDRVDVGLVLPDTPTTARLEPGATFNSMCTHRLRIRATSEVDDKVVGWLRRAYDAAG